MRVALKVLTAAALIAYPVIVYIGLTEWGTTPTALILAGILALRLVVTKPTFFIAGTCAAGVGLALAGLSLLFRQTGFLLYYPVAVNVLFFAFFAFTLYRPPTVIERIARLTNPDLSSHGVRYTRKVTQIWCAFFLLNGTGALALTLAGNMQLWTIYNGGISYALMGILFAGEWLIRKKFIAKYENANA